MKEVTEDFIQHSIKQDHHWNLIYTPALLKAQGNSQGSREYKGLYHVLIWGWKEMSLGCIWVELK